MSNAVQNDQHPHAIKLHWMRHDLRVQDNQALNELCNDKTAKVVVVYVFDLRWLKENEFGAKHLGKYRQAFIDQALLEVKSELDKLNISFLCLTGDPVETITTLIAQLAIKTISAEFHAGYNERQQLDKVLARNADTKLLLSYSNALFHPEQLPFDLADMPDVFSPFRRKIEKNFSVIPPCSNIQARPLHNKITCDIGCPEYIPAIVNYNNGYCGGQASALSRIDDYFFKSHGIAEYKITRNGLDGWDFSSRLSAFLAIGCVSPRHVYFILKQYEQQHIANDSTYWLFFELLWREFFHWQAVKQGPKFFQYSGIQNATAPIARHNDSVLEKWKTGQTGYPIVDACMRQLTETGWMSNRGRQLAASCFVHELNLDWRYGAAHFEELLVDFDVASNYGNWLYLAGVGSDPRGHRQFNLEKQTQIYDPQGTFRATWLK